MIRSRYARLVLAAAALLATGLPARAGFEFAGQSLGGDVPLMSDNIDVVGQLAMPGAIGATFRDDVMYVTGSEGLRTYDISNPALPLPLGHLPLPHFENEDVSIGGNTLLISADHAVYPNLLYVIDIANPRTPLLRNVFQVSQSAHTSSCVPGTNCRWNYMAGGSGVAIVDTTTGARVKTFAAPEVGGSHDVQFDSAGYAWVVGGRGTAGYDITDPLNPKLVAKTDASGSKGPLNDFIHHNSFRPDVTPGVPGDIVLITEEDYLNYGCNGAGSFQTWRINGPLSTTNPAIMTNLDAWDVSQGTLPTGEDSRVASGGFCSSHYFTEHNGIVADAWYQQGVRFLDVTNPSDIKQVGYFVIPQSEAWAAYFIESDPSLVYVVDATRGITILRLKGTSGPALAPAETIGFEPVSKPSEKWGYACRLAGVAA